MAFLKFLGTAGARFVMIEQLRASGGIWISSNKTNVLIDPGPGSIVRCSESRPKLDPLTLDGIILTHRHLDHANDINVMIEAMTQGGFKKRGVVFCPQDAIGKDSVILKYAIDFPKKIAILKPKSVYRVKKFAFATSVRHIHPAETYGLRFRLNNTKVGLISDTRYFKGISDFYKTDLLIIPVVFLEPRPGVDHLSLVDTEEIIRKCRPRRVILTHFGRTMLRAGPVKEARRLSIRLNTKVEAAYDGLRIAF